MRKYFVAALMLFGVAMVQPASAAVASAVQPAASNALLVAAVTGDQLAVGAGTSGLVHQVDRRYRGWRRRHHRRYHRRHRRHRRGNGGAFGAGLAVGIVGALIAQGISESAAEDRFARCESEFRSFDPSTGTYITYGGEERLCPYLR